MTKYVELNDIERRNKIKRNLILGGTIAVVAVAYIWHRRKLDAVITMTQDMLVDTRWSSFDAGVKYGFELKSIEAELQNLAKDHVVDAT